MKRTVRAAYWVAALAVALAPSVASAQAWKEQINKQIIDSRIVRDFMNGGYTRSHDVFYDLLAQGNTQTVNLDLLAGRRYQFVGKCDNDCRDLDFKLYDESENLVDSDTQTDDYPVVTVTPSRSAKYRLRIIMANCSTSSCGWGVVALSRTGEATNVANGSSGGSNTAWKDQINKQILDSRIVRDFMNGGYTRSHDVFYDLLPQGSSQRVSIDLVEGRAYQFVGKCDNDCRDVDFKLYDDDGTMIDSDLQADDYPVVTVRANRSRKYSLEVIMANCSTRTCGWGVIILAK
jgi:hypothetical protein